MVVQLSHYSPSSLGLFAASPAMFVLSKVLNIRQPVGVPAHRGTAVEAGVSAGLFEPDRLVEDCIAIAQAKYDGLTAISGDPRRDQYGADIGAMVTSALEELRPYGIPTHAQGRVSWQPEGLKAPIIGFFDFAWEQHGILVDLKTTEKLPSQIKVSHARQVSLYAASISDNLDARLSYVTPKRRATYRLENIREHCNALHRMAIACERFLALSDDPKFFISITSPDYESFYWSNPAARQLGYETWNH
jgi:hypothetical protein